MGSGREGGNLALNNLWIYKDFFFPEQAIILWELKLIKSNTIPVNAFSYFVRAVLFVSYDAPICILISAVTVLGDHGTETGSFRREGKAQAVGCNRLECLMGIYSGLGSFLFGSVQP